jgi:hypothetical protein
MASLYVHVQVNLHVGSLLSKPPFIGGIAGVSCCPHPLVELRSHEHFAWAGSVSHLISAFPVVEFRHDASLLGIFVVFLNLVT